ncbi:unnamed protein product [Adineta steineri]|uniref:Uncharacterized protein n=1 Tax=Adineta steineri TaxID=433720 RepID=A0A819REY3_9BILA|nr:unnamed protein product [Adineta steineri]
MHLWKESQDSIIHRIDTAIAFLNSQLNDWEVMKTERVAFELIIPTLFDLLEKEFGITFKFRDCAALLALNHKKMSMIKDSMIYETQSSCHHTLEAFIGKINFDRLVHLKCQGSFMASPASTAAYLMNASVWDEEAEQYLRRVTSHCEKYGNRGVPTFWPTTIFASSWVICNLLENGFEANKLDKYCLDRIKDMLKRALTIQDGIVGFAEHLLPDADDTAKSLTVLHYLGDSPSVQPLITIFQVDTHFRCYLEERNPSISANCNVLISLLHVSTPEQYTDQIVKVVTFICEKWWTNDGMLTDKWHLSWLYPAMLVSQGLTLLLYRHNDDIPLPSLLDNLIKDKVPIVLFQLIVRILQSQSMETGSWGANGSRQETSYAIIALANLASLPFVESIREQIDVAIARGRAYLQSTSHTNSTEVESKELLWIGKIVYGSNQNAEEIINRLVEFVNLINTHPRIVTASKFDQDQLQLELKSFILAQFKQCEDNMRLEAQTSMISFETPRSSYFRWIHTTAIDHFGTPCVFAFLTCLLSNTHDGRADFFPTSEIKYIVRDCISHISIKSRIYNDYGSLRRDREEKNLNSIFFPEFEGLQNRTDTELKEELMHIDEYESKCLDVSMMELRRIATQKFGTSMGNRLYEVIKLYYNSNTIYQQIYALKDIVTRS